MKGLEGILNILGTETPFDKKTGDYTEEGTIALGKLLELVDNLDYIGALGKKSDELEGYCDEIVRSGF